MKKKVLNFLFGACVIMLLGGGVCILSDINPEMSAIVCLIGLIGIILTGKKAIKNWIK